jgi:peptidoglycan/LPS O-acetylase OafA/YrhL
MVMAALAMAVVLTVRPRTPGVFSPEVVQELKGFAILAIVFSHIGYFLVADHRFLFPLSTIAGVGVDLFLLVSGFGLVASALKTARKPFDFYKRRLDKLFIPLWTALVVFFAMDFFILGKTYTLDYMLQSFVGFFASADIYGDLNSPLWYITLIIFFYLVFPLLFMQRRPMVSAVLVLAAAYAIHMLTLPLLSGVAHLHELHLWAFPVGMAFAALLNGKVVGKISPLPLYLGLFAVLLGSVGYFALHSNIGAGVFLEQGTSILTALLLCALFLIKKFEIKLLYLFGVFSYEIYLFHWPIMYRYDMFFRFFPPWLAVLLYVALFLGIGWLFQEAHRRLSTSKSLSRN